MSDHITYALGLSTDDITKQPMFNVLKLVPFGDFEQLLPWLTRRLEEINVIYFFSQSGEFLASKFSILKVIKSIQSKSVIYFFRQLSVSATELEDGARLKSLLESLSLGPL